ncbi:MAG: alpha/beta hydrolase [Planctomycetales bacterium]|nr:alpha/beta hydrolase [Planctomycetales bacterium]
MTCLRQVSANGHEFNCYDSGEGPTLLFVHGFPLDHTQWSAQFDELSRVARVIAPDLRGFGVNAAVEGTLQMSDFADDLAALLDALDISTPITLCGLSMGGYIAWQFWDRYRERLNGLILCDTRAKNDTEAVARGRLQLAERVIRDGFQTAGEDMLKKLLAPENQTELPHVAAQLLTVMTTTHRTTIAAALRGMAERPDMTERLGEIDLPVLVICGSEDVITPAEEMRQVAAALPRATYLEVPHAGHLSPLENPGIVNGEIRAFLGSLS